MVTSTLESKVALNWYEKKEWMTGQGTGVPYLVIGSDETPTLGIPLLPLAEAPFKCSLFLKSSVFQGERLSHEQVEHGDLEINVELNLPEDTQLETVFFHNAQISLVNKVSDNVLATSRTRAGIAPQFHLAAHLDASASEQYLRMLEGIPSALHLMVRTTFYVPAVQRLKSIESTQPLSLVRQAAGFTTDELWANLTLNSYDPLTKNFSRGLAAIQSDPVRRRKSGGPRQPVFAVKNNVVSSNHAALQPVNHLSAVNLVHSPAVGLNAVALNRIENLSLVIAVQNLPLVDDEKAKWFKDQADKNLFWAVPEFTLVKPPLNNDPLVSPFRFLFRTLGMDANGKPVLEGEILFTLRAVVPEPVKKEILNNNAQAKIRMIDTRSIAISMEIPFFNEQNELTTTSVVTEEFRWNQDTLVATFRLSNQWIRLAYGVLSVPVAQVEKRLKINLAYSFDGMGPKLPALNLMLLNQNIFKIAALPLITKKTKSKPSAARYFNVDTKTLVDENGRAIAFNDYKKPRSRAVTPLLGNLSASTASRITQPAINKISLLPLANHNKINKLANENKYVRRTFLKREKVEAEFDCTKYGSFYQEQDNQGDIASIGCKEPYRLGEIRFSLYTLLNEIQEDDFKVYQSTQIPNRFLVVPKRYVVTRFEPQREQMAFEPCLRLYSTVDAEDLQRSRCILDATLAPDIDRFQLEDLHFRLSQFTSYTPYISFPGEIEHTETYSWGMPGSLVEDADTFSLGAFIRMVISAKIEGVLTIHSMLKSTGLSGKVTFTLPDGSTFNSDLLVSLESIRGPFVNGALLTEKTNSSLSLRNGLIHRLQLTEIHAYKNYEDKITIPVEKTLEPGEVFTLEIDSERIHVPQYVVESTPETLSEVRQYLEDIECQVLFVTNIDFAKEKLKTLRIRFGLTQADAHETTLDKDTTVSEQLLIMPLTNFFDQRQIEYRVTGERDDGSSTQGDWRTASLAEGNIINITTSILQPS